MAVVGAGICGLSCAYHLAAEHGIQAVVLDAGAVGWGASGRNAGFVCHGAIRANAAHLADRHGEDAVRRAFAAESDGIARVMAIAADENFDIGRQGEAIVTVADRPSHWAQLAAECETLRRFGAGPAELASRDAFVERGFISPEQHGALFAPGYGIHPLRYVQGLAGAAVRRGARLHGASPALALAKEGVRYCLSTPGGCVRTKRIVLAMNGYWDEALYRPLAGRAMPVLSNIAITRPLSPGERAEHRFATENPVSNTRNLLSYFRMLPGGRLLFGGRGDTTGSPADSARMRRALERRLAEIFPAWAGIDTEFFWRGFIAATRRFTPAVGRMADDPGVHYAFGCHGNGVAFMTWAGHALARLAATGDEGAIPALFRAPPPRLPPPTLRPWALRALLALYAIRDRLG